MTETTAIITRPTAQDYARANRAPNTYRAYRAAWRAFAAWCAEHNFPALPAGPLTVADYLAHAAQHHKASTLGVHVAAIRAAHKAAGQPDPTADERVAATMRGIRRVHGQPPAQREPLTLDDLRALVRACGDDLPGLRDKALLLVGFAAALRRSELVALDVEHIRLNGVLRITLTRSKTDQEGQGITKTIPRLADAELCPVRALRAWLDAAGIASGAIFRSVNRWGKVGARLSAYDVARIVKRRAEAAGLDARMLAGHSLRAGFATQAALAGLDPIAIAEVTGHRNLNTLRKYIRAAGRVQADAISRVMGGQA
jgi:site-specific recombinase XerD